MSKIHILDDDNVSARLLSNILQKSGHQVSSSIRSEDAWVRMSESPVDLLILDTELEGEMGWDVLARIRSDVVFRDLPVLVHSVNSRRDSIERYLALGVQGILVKPCSADRLNHDVERLVRRPWCEHLFESEEVVQSRTGLTCGGVRKLYREARQQFIEAQESVMRLGEAPDDDIALGQLSALRSCSVNIGYRLMDRFVEEVRAAAGSGDRPRVSALVSRFVVLIRIIENRVGEDPRSVAEADMEGAAAQGDELAPSSGTETPAA